MAVDRSQLPTTRTRKYDADHPPDLPDAVRVTVATKPSEHDTVRRILAEKGGSAQ